MKMPDDPILLELLPELIDDWLQKLDTEFQELLSVKDAENTYRFGHTLKGSCLQFGIDEVAELGIEMMADTKKNDWEAIAAKEEPIRTYLLEAKDFAQANS